LHFYITLIKAPPRTPPTPQLEYGEGQIFNSSRFEPLLQPTTAVPRQQGVFYYNDLLQNDQFQNQQNFQRSFSSNDNYRLNSNATELTDVNDDVCFCSLKFERFLNKKNGQFCIK